MTKSEKTSLISLLQQSCINVSTELERVIFSSSSDLKLDGTSTDREYSIDSIAKKLLYRELQCLEDNFPAFVIGEGVEHQVGKQPSIYILVDPIDGTREIKTRSGQAWILIGAFDGSRLDQFIGGVCVPIGFDVTGRKEIFRVIAGEKAEKLMLVNGREKKLPIEPTTRSVFVVLFINPATYFRGCGPLAVFHDQVLECILGSLKPSESKIFFRTKLCSNAAILDVINGTAGAMLDFRPLLPKMTGLKPMCAKIYDVFISLKIAESLSIPFLIFDEGLQDMKKMSILEIEKDIGFMIAGNEKLMIPLINAVKSTLEKHWNLTEYPIFESFC
ncbi:MAG: hypothetical protein ACXQS8_08570 [Candidatus Helarchaeales archaeon]